MEDDLTPKALGELGGKACSKKLGPEHYRHIGRMGGAKTRDTHPSEYYEEIGRKGGLETSRRYGPEHYARMSRMGVERARQLIRRGKELEAEEAGRAKSP